jgi:nucleoside-diphosphate-sugar epimerase
VRKGRPEIGHKVETIEYSPNQFERIFAGLDVLIITLGISRQNSEFTFFDVNYRIVSNAVDASVKDGVKRVIYVSGLGVGPHNTESYFLSKYLAEEKIRKSGIEYFILRPSYIIGSGDEMTPYLIKKLLNNDTITVYGTGRYRLQPIYILDVCKLILKLISVDFPSATIDVVGNEIITYRDYITLVAKVIGKRPRLVYRSLEEVIQAAMRTDNPEISVEELEVLVSDFVSSCKVLKKYYEITPTPLDSAVKKTVKDILMTEDR